MQGRKVANLENYIKPVGHVQRNLRVKVTKFPEWMSDELKATLTALFEKHAISYKGLESGYYLEVGVAPIVKKLPFINFAMIVPEMADMAVSETLNYWVDAAQQQQEVGGAGNTVIGVDLVFYEVDATHTRPVRSWYLPEAFPTNTGNLIALFDINDGTERDAVLDDNISNLSVNFIFDKTAARYNTPAVVTMAAEAMAGLEKERVGYAAPIVPGSIVVFTLDEHDPNQPRTIELIVDAAKNAGINVVILDDKLNLLGDQPVNWDLVLKHAVKMPAQWTSQEQATILDNVFGTVLIDPPVPSPKPVPEHDVVPANWKARDDERTKDLWLRETHVFADGKLGQRYMNSFEHVRKARRTDDNDYTFIVRNGQNVSMPRDYVERLHMVLDDLGVPQAHEITEQSKYIFKDLVGTEGELNRGMTRSLQAENFAQAEDEHLRQATASVKIPPKLRDKDQPGNEAPEGWVKPTATQADADPAQDQSPAQDVDQ